MQPHYADEGYIVYAGGLYTEKGVDLILDSLPHMGYAWPLKIAGDGPEAVALQQQATRLTEQSDSRASVQF